MPYKKIWYIFIIKCCCFTTALAQNSVTDSTIKKLELNEVIVCEHFLQQDDVFNFYRNNKSATTEEILLRMPGISLIRRGSYGMEPMLRGYSAGQINLTLDGMKIVGACTDKMDPVNIYVEPANLQSLQVATGASGSGMGSTLGGGINMALKEPEFLCNNKPYIGFNSGYNTINKSTSNSLFLNLNNNKIAWRISGAYRNANDYKTGGSISVPFSGYEKTNVASAIIWQVSEKHSLKADYLDDRGWNIGFPALTMDVGYAHASIASLTHNFQNDKNFFQSIKSKVYYNTIWHSMDDTRRPFVPMHMDMPGESKTMGYFSEFIIKKIQKHTIAGRADASHSFTRAEMTMYPINEPAMFMLTLPDNYRINTGFFLKDDIKIDSVQLLSVSGRVDRMLSVMDSEFGKKQWSVFGSFPLQRVFYTSNIQLAYNRILSKSTSVKAGIGYAERAPTPNELYGYYLFNRLDNFDYTGNLLLKKEQAKQAEIEVNMVQKRTIVQAVFYYHHINNYILGELNPTWVAMTIGARGVKSYTNLSFARIYGGDFTFSYLFNKHLEHISTAKITIGADADRKALPQMPPLKCLHAFKFKKKGWFVQPEAEWALPQYRNNASFGEMETETFSIFNLRLGYKFNTGGHAVHFSTSIENITDRTYREHLDFSAVTRPGRSFIFNLSYSFH
jgi:iron complex outermembrane receptor protein